MVVLNNCTYFINFSSTDSFLAVQPLDVIRADSRLTAADRLAANRTDTRSTVADQLRVTMADSNTATAAPASGAEETRPVRREDPVGIVTTPHRAVKVGTLTKANGI
jgi:hypothetical protein